MGAILVVSLLFLAFFYLAASSTDSRDSSVLQSLKDGWQNTPPSWGTSNDPCGTPWDGVICKNSRVVALKLSSMGLKGKLGGDIGGLTELRSLDLAANRDLVGSISPALGNLLKLETLILSTCGFSGNIPEELGNLSELTFLSLYSNNFTGTIPATLGKLSKLYWLDLADNQLTGALPVSTSGSWGLDKLHMAKHFHFSNNHLSGTIPPELFSSEMVLIHILFDGNNFSGSIPPTLGLVQTLEVLRVDRNSLTGNVPSTLNNLINVNELHLANNMLTGPLPNLTQMSSLNYVDLSNNSFSSSVAPEWFSTLQSLTTLIVEYGLIRGNLPEGIFSLPHIQQVKLKNNAFSGTLNMGDSISQRLQLVDLQNNNISSVTSYSGYTNALMLTGNPVCDADILSNTNYCQLQQQQAKPYITSLVYCGRNSCPPDEKLNPRSCECAYPYEGTLYFRGPSFRELSNITLFHLLEMSLLEKFNRTPFIRNPFFNADDYLQMQLALFPANGKYFNREDIQRIGFDLHSQNYKPPDKFGPYYFFASPYPFSDIDNGSTSTNTGLVIGIAVGCAFLVVCLIGMGTYAIQQKRRAEKANPNAFWLPSGNDSGSAPQLKGARWFSYDELKKCTDNFSTTNVVGSGGFGMVYRGTLVDGKVVAIKRAQQGSMQGGLEFKTEIELLSRVHHKNLVGLVGFCAEQGEQILVYEFMPNGTLRQSLAGKSGIYLDWKRRLRITLGSARGLTYLHELANPPIIHRDVKSTNILLDECLNAKVADFGLSKLVSDSVKGHVSTQVKGTMGYLDPEYYMSQQLTEKSDVYSFGVVMLELLTAKLPIEKGKYIVREVRMSMNKNDEEYYGLKHILDPTIFDNTANLIGFGKFLELAMQCVEEVAANRPTMSEVVKAIEKILQNDGINTSSTSASSSATDFVTSKTSSRHPYNDASQKESVNNNSQ
ncbi:putative leucine-rich repeat receptor-like protein kinase [Cucumis melo var. makuwa]|uniref:non-specific serine/threonine protein kinase n=2 Tax=Cucumis melo TaxID=3656 RepID=A0A5D3E2J9_CUCMM|nr:putative leucine-rich repeat receptor-like protein kinase [Cucumis melo var. makuwa]TYK29999.1 putative leucine-rich repeat receptor-like protein kinase [Cucumis melo var. makuwa]